MVKQNTMSCLVFENSSNGQYPLSDELPNSVYAAYFLVLLFTGILKNGSL
jgi:hypothetical protein